MDTIRQYFDGVQQLLDKIDTARVGRLVGLLEAAWRDGRQVLLMGNGGSSSTASHIVNDLQKCIQLESGKALRAMCLCDNTALVMAWANDSEYANIFEPQVECWVQPGDVVIGISGSGNSANVVRAIEAANRLGAATFGLAGFDGGQLARVAAETLTVPSDNMQQIEDLHMIALHVAFSELRDRVRKSA